MTSDLELVTNFCLIKLHIIMIVNLSFACSTETAIDLLYMSIMNYVLIFLFSSVLIFPLLFTLPFCQKLRLSAFSLHNKMNENE